MGLFDEDMKDALKYCLKGVNVGHKYKVGDKFKPNDINNSLGIIEIKELRETELYGCSSEGGYQGLASEKHIDSNYTLINNQSKTHKYNVGDIVTIHPTDLGLRYQIPVEQGADFKITYVSPIRGSYELESLKTGSGCWLIKEDLIMAVNSSKPKETFNVGDIVVHSKSGIKIQLIDYDITTDLWAAKKISNGRTGSISHERLEDGTYVKDTATPISPYEQQLSLYQTSNNLIKMLQHDINVKQEERIQNCSHKWKRYVGLMESFDYCELCDKKKEQA